MLIRTLPMIASFVFLSLILWTRGLNRRESIVCAAIPFSAALVLITEALGWFRMLAAWPVFWSWSAIALACGLYWISIRSSSRNRPEAAYFRQLSRAWLFAILCVVALCIVVGVSAFVGAPNTWDSMEYHLPRVVQWAGNRSLALYPTVDYQQLFAAPFAELAMLHTYLLAGDDTLVNLVQWFAWIGCILGSSLLAWRFGASPPVQVLAALLTATLPSAVVSSSGPKNDLVVAFWIQLTVYLLAAYARSPSWIVASALGTSIGLAILTKGTAYVYLPAMLLAGFLMLPWDVRRRLFLHSALILACAVALNLPQFQRNYALSGSVLGFSSNDGEGRYPWRNAEMTPGQFLGNVVRNVACHLGTRSPALNTRISNALGALLRRVGVDPDDPATTWTGAKFKIFNFTPHEIFAGNPVHLFLFLVSVCAAAIAFRKPSTISVLYPLGIIGSFLTLCALLRYQPWNARIHAPLFVLASVPSAMFLAGSKLRSVQSWIAWGLIAIAWPFALFNHLRPIIGIGLHESIFHASRDEVYLFDEHEGSAKDYIAAADLISQSGCATAAVDASVEHYEYPVFALLLRRGVVKRVVYAGVANRSKAFADNYNTATPCAIVCLACGENAAKVRQYGQTGSRRVWPMVTVFLPHEPASAN